MCDKNMIKDRKWHLVYKINMADPNAWHSIPIDPTVNYHIIKTDHEHNSLGRGFRREKKENEESEK